MPEPLPQFYSSRLYISAFQAKDAGQAYACITPGLTRYLSFEPPASALAFQSIWQQWQQDMASGVDLELCLRTRGDNRFIGLAGLHRQGPHSPELGIWIREDEQNRGYGREAILALVCWAHERLALDQFYYPVAQDNLASRRLIESLGGTIQSEETRLKFKALIYRLDWLNIPEKYRQNMPQLVI